LASGHFKLSLVDGRLSAPADIFGQSGARTPDQMGDGLPGDAKQHAALPSAVRAKILRPGEHMDRSGSGRAAFASTPRSACERFPTSFNPVLNASRHGHAFCTGEWSDAPLASQAPYPVSRCAFD
jgi:hypothetical protein